MGLVRMLGSSLVRAGLVVLGIILAPVLGGQPTAGAAATPTTVGGPFTLTASDGSLVTEQSYRGKWLLVFFGYTFCPNTCPTTLIEIAHTLEELGPAASSLQAVFVSVDPQRDTPDVVGAFTRSFDPRIAGLTGTPAQVADIAQAYGAYYAPHRTGPGADDYVVDHGTYIYLMDPQGAFVRAFDADTPGDRMAEILRKFVAPTHRDAVP
jgi:protein SCO1/2